MMTTTDFNAAAGGRPCPRCGTMSVLGAQFCGSCGGSLAAAPPPPPLPPPQFLNASAFSGGVTEEGTVATAPDAAFDNALTKVSSVPGTQVTWQQRPNGIRFRYLNSNVFSDKYEALLTIAPYGMGQSQITVNLRVLHGDMALLYFCIATFVVALTFIDVDLFWVQQGILSLLLPAVPAVYYVFYNSSQKPRELARKVIKNLTSGAVTSAPAPLRPPPPVPTPAPSAPQAFAPPPPQPPPPPETQNAEVAQLKALAELRAKEFITQEEYDAKKREILARML